MRTTTTRTHIGKNGCESDRGSEHEQPPTCCGTGWRSPRPPQDAPLAPIIFRTLVGLPPGWGGGICSACRFECEINAMNQMKDASMSSTTGLIANGPSGGDNTNENRGVWSAFRPDQERSGQWLACCASTTS